MRPLPARDGNVMSGSAISRQVATLAKRRQRNLTKRRALPIRLGPEHMTVQLCEGARARSAI